MYFLVRDELTEAWDSVCAVITQPGVARETLIKDVRRTDSYGSGCCALLLSMQIAVLRVLNFDAGYV